MQLTPHRPNEFALRERQDYSLRPQDLVNGQSIHSHGQGQDVLQQIEGDSLRKLFAVQANADKPVRVPGYYRLDHRIHVLDGQRSDWTLCPLEKDPTVQQGTAWMPKSNERTVRGTNRAVKRFFRAHPELASLKVRYYIVHELKSRGYKAEIEARQEIPIHVIERISLQQAILEHSRASLEWLAPKLAIAALFILGTIVIAAFLPAILSILLGVLLLAMLAFGIGSAGGSDHPHGARARGWHEHPLRCELARIPRAEVVVNWTNRSSFWSPITKVQSRR